MLARGCKFLGAAQKGLDFLSHSRGREDERPWEQGWRMSEIKQGGFMVGALDSRLYLYAPLVRVIMFYNIASKST